jgi:hypothetical protein
MTIDRCAAWRSRSAGPAAPAGICAVLGLAALLGSAPAAASRTWIEVGEGEARGDLVLLADAGVIDLPLLEWPVPVADVRRAIAAARIDRFDRIGTAAGRLAFERIRRRVEAASGDGARLDALGVAAGRPALLRDFDAPVREETEITLRAGAARGRWTGELVATVAASPADGQAARLDGSHVSAQFGNWLVSAGFPERWWGPGHESSLILSNNARPMPQLGLQRASSEAFRTPWLRWIGPWRLTATLARMEGGRRDISRPLFFGMRVSARPARWLELSLSRSAQFCGDGRPCGPRQFSKMLFGNDTVGATVSARDEPGNQMAGYEARLSSPWRTLPLALYQQTVGEDRIGDRPSKKLQVYGIEGWVPLGGAMLRAYVEQSDTACDGTSSAPLFNCSYRNHLFDVEGYRYRGRAIGHTTDSDSDTWAAGLRLAMAGGSEWRLRGRAARLNRDAIADPTDPLTAVPLRYRSLEAAWAGAWRGSRIEIVVGGERREPRGGRARDDAFGFVRWQLPLGGER